MTPPTKICCHDKSGDGNGGPGGAVKEEEEMREVLALLAASRVAQYISSSVKPMREREREREREMDYKSL